MYEVIMMCVKIRNFAGSRHLYHYAMQVKKIIISTYSYSLAEYIEYKATKLDLSPSSVD